MRLPAALGRPAPAALVTALLLTPVTALMVVLGTDPAGPGDYFVFGPGGAALLTGHWSDIYAQPAMQAGVLELLPFGAMDRLLVTGPVGWAVALTICSTVTAFLAAIVLRPSLGDDRRSSVVAAAGALLMVLAGPITTAWSDGHPAEVLIPLVWAAAGRCALRGHPLVAASLVAGSSGFEAWGVLGAPVLLLAPRVPVVRSAATGLAVLAVLWVPFVLAGPFRMFDLAWPVSDDSLLHLVAPEATAFPWALRLGQAAAAVGAGAAVALLLRRSDPALGPWAVVLATVSARIALDPVLLGYYWDPTKVAAVGAVVLLVRRRHLLGTAVAAVAVLLTSTVAPPVPRAGALLALTLVVAVSRLRRPDAPRRAPGDPGARRDEIVLLPR